jgi:multidrug efflux pump subunit AcrB
MSWLRSLIVAGVRNPVYANVLMVCLLVGGAVSARTLVVETYPEFSLDRISITVAYPGASPEEVEQNVARKVEEAIEGVPGIKRTWSRSEEDGVQIITELTEDVTSPDVVMLDIKDRVDRITSFPPEVERPVVTEFTVRTPVINLALHGQAMERTLKEIAAEIRQELLATGVVSQVEVTGARDYEIAIAVSRESLLRYGLTLEDVRAIVARNCRDVPAGTLRTDREEFTIRTTGQRYTAREFEDLVLIARPDGTLIRLGQVATITDGFEEEERYGRFDGQPAVMVEVFKTPAQDTNTIATAVRAYADRKRAALPDGLGLTVWADSSRVVNARIGMLVKNGVLGMLLVLVLLSLFLNPRVSFYVAAGLPVAFAGTFVVMHFLGQTLNMFTLFGLIMVTGILVDDAVVIADSFRGRVAAGDAPALAAVNGAQTVALPVLASSLTTIMAFAPLLFVVGIVGRLVEVLPIVVISAIVFSAVEAFCILPSHLQHCLHAVRDEGGQVKRAGRVRATIERWIDATIERVYRPITRRALRARGLTLCAAGASFVVVAGLVLGGRIPFTLLPQVDGDVFRAQVRFPHGMPFSATEQAVLRLERAALGLNQNADLKHAGKGPLVQNVFSSVGQWSGVLRRQGGRLGEVTIELKPAEVRRLNGDRILAAWAEATGPIENVVGLRFERAELGPTEKPIEIRLLHDDLDTLEAAADAVAAELAGYPGVSGIEHDLEPGKREVRIRLKPLARTLGVTVDDLAGQLRSGFYGGEAVRVQRGPDEVRVAVRFPDDQRRGLSDIENLRIAGAGGEEIPFHELAEFTIERGYAAISHQDGKRRVRILANVDERRANAERIVGTVERTFLRTLPQRYPGLRYVLEGQHAQIIESLDSLIAGFVVALVAIYAVLAAMLASYYQPVVIMAAVPLGFVGAVLGHAVMGYDMTIMSVFGMVALSGVVVNDSLVLLDQAKRLLAEGRSVFDAVLDAGAIRFRAVVLTTVTTIGGLAPLMFERSTQAQSLIPMAISLTFGLAVATVLTLVVVPALYLVVNDGRRVARWLWRGGAFPTPEAVEPIRGASVW